MKYLLMMSAPAGPYQIFDWKTEDFEAHMAHMKSLNHDLRQRGEFVEVQALTSPDRAKLVRAGQDGTPITDGVFPESKEFLAGYWLIDVESRERAYEVAAQASMAPGPGGVPLHMAIEVREVMSGKPDQP